MKTKSLIHNSGQRRISPWLTLLLILFFFCFFGLAKSSLAACTGSSPNLTAASASYTDVNDCVQAATYGDTIRVPAGSATWPATLTLTKGCWLQGAGKDATTITSTQTGGPDVPMINIAPDSASIASNARFKVSGFTFDGGSNAGTGIAINGPDSPPVTNMIITDNKFTNFSNTTRSGAAAYGVIYENVFLNVVQPFRTERHDQYTWNAYTKIDWTKDGGPDSDCRKVRPDLPPNTSCFMYFEDNYVYWTNNYGTGNASFQETGQGARFTIRYNTDDFTGINKCDRIIDGQCWPSLLATYELHDSRPDLNYAPMGAIVYGNLLRNDAPTNQRNYVPLWQRGGKLLGFFNYLKDVHAGSYGVGIGIRNQFPQDPVNSPESVQYANDTYIWSNLWKDYNVSSPSLMSVSQSGDACYGLGLNGYSGACMHGSSFITGTATGGSNSSFADTSKDFVSLGVQTGDWVVNDSCYTTHPSENCYSDTTGCQIASISLDHHTLSCASNVSYSIASGDTYYIVHNGAGMMQNSEWWKDNSSCTPGSCTAGIGCGSTLPSGSCTTEGVGYWYTTQGNCGNLDGWIGRAEDRTGGINTKIQGTLYRCMSGTWQAYWSPYIYPHPLRSEGGSDTTPPAAPSGLTVN